MKRPLAADKLGRAKDCAPEIAFVQAHAADCSVALEAAARRQAAPAGDAQRHQAQQHPHRHGHRRGPLRHRPGHRDAGPVHQ
ncbi:MAG: hypothetical protein V8T36_05860 [Ruthenibacterium lactatiformans]